jgi:DNA-directed RNA polymerase subunit RPC12/RpoP
MDAVRCLRCGGTRWTLLPGSLERRLSEPCEACGGRVVLERRHPGALQGTIRERREAERPERTPTVSAWR